MRKAYVSPLAMRAQLAAELEQWDLSGLVHVTASDLGDLAEEGELSKYLTGEVNTSLTAMALAVLRMRSMPAAELAKRLEAFGDSGTLATQLLAERHQVGGDVKAQKRLTQAAFLMLAMYGALALASREATDDEGNEEYQV